MPQISVIVPVYKVEQYLSACVDSILTQTFRDFELILVDDGSPDNCGSMCDAYAAQDPRVRVIHQQNGGLSAARNTGIELAKGDYIAYVDSDDYVSNRYLELLLQRITESNAEIAVCKTQTFVDGKKPIEPDLSKPNSHTLSGWDAVMSIYQGDASVPVNAWGKLYRAELISDLRFPEGRLHEDQAYVPIACYRAKQVACLDAGIYFYRDRPESITTKKFSPKRYDDVWAIDQCLTFFEAEDAQEIIQAAREKRKRVLCVYACLAAGAGVTPPEKYAISPGAALRYLRKHVSEEKYAYCLSQVHPKLVRPYSYWVKLKRLLHRSDSV